MNHPQQDKTFTEKATETAREFSDRLHGVKELPQQQESWEERLYKLFNELGLDSNSDIYTRKKFVAFIATELERARVEEREQIAKILTQELDIDNMLPGWERHWKEASNNRYVEKCIECENADKIIQALSDGKGEK